MDGMKPLLWILAIVVIGFFGKNYLEQSIVFKPQKGVQATPSAMGLRYQEGVISTPDGVKVHSWYFPADGRAGLKRMTLLFLHGNAGNISNRLQKISFFLDLGMGVFIIDYRGYGASTGSPSEKGLYKDAQAAYDHLTRVLKVAPESIIVYGESLGASVAIDLASKNMVAGLIVEGTYSSAADMTRHLYPMLPTFLVGIKMDNASKIDSVRVPKLFIHSRSDEVVPFTLGQKLFDLAPEPKEMLVIEGSHNDSFFRYQDQVESKVKAFLAEFGA